MQQKKTNPINIELPTIKSEWLEFARLIAYGKNQTEAYKAIYPNSSNENAWSRGSELARNSKVKAWIDAIKCELLTKEGYTLTEHIKELEELRQIAIASGNVGAAVNASVHKGKVSGHYVERKEIEITHRKAIDEFLEILDDKPDDKHVH